MTMIQQTKHYGWTPDLPDHRDLRYSIVSPLALAVALPPLVDLRPQCPPVYDQGQLGSCTANAIGGAFQFELMRQKLAVFNPSRLFIYYNERALEGHVSQDSGAQLRDGVKTVSTLGVCDETLWPYDITKFAKKPTKTLYTAAKKNLAIQYTRLNNMNINELKSCLASGNPFVFGFTVYQSFESSAVAQSGVLNMPAKTESVLGGHAVMAAGYDDSKNAFIIRNSWGSAWGLQGYFYMPYDYITSTDLADDFWTISQVN
ncbi:C1 family peptidase [Mucilaginibacter sp. FT3.2]|uniref:C1 family peptidase n=1 Tax=Mucilaginibacter sp. FT3.2 TaxID=2723090 RepID=UPI0017E42125|nr:C1 family peptidase [Mucilaginibacter sp. FT3.2]MBB6230270.1 C1A family cysteine protease [Mucilaginibacter sp. FT3.2]